MTCVLEFKNGTKGEVYLNFKNTELKINGKSIFLTNLANITNSNSLKFIVSQSSEDPKNPQQSPNQSSRTHSYNSGGGGSGCGEVGTKTKNNSSSNYNTIILVCIIFGVLVLFGIITGMVLLVRTCKAKKMNMVNNNKIDE